MGAACRLFDGLDADARASILSELEWKFALGGSVVVEPGDRCVALWFVIHGRLRVHGPTDSATARWKVIEELPPGGVLGDVEIQGDGVHAFRVAAARDSEIGVLPIEAFHRLAHRWPLLWQNLARWLLRHVDFEQGEKVFKPNSEVLALVPANPSVPLRAFGQRLHAAVACIDKAEYVAGDQVDQAIGANAYRDADADDINTWTEVDRRFARWAESRERECRYLLLESEQTPTPWTQRCLRQADRAFVIARAGDAIEPGAAERFLLTKGAGTGSATLILLHDSASVLPTGTADWLAWRPHVENIYHVCLDDDAHMERLGRLVTDRAVGLVLGGGGARGSAHIGVIEALQEVGIPIDLVGGTSAGGGVAGLLACGAQVPEMTQRFYGAFVGRAPFEAYDLPYTSLIRKDAIDGVARYLYGEADVEDLWIPWFSVSCDISRGEMVVHRRGRVWKAVRATTALPGVLPPMCIRGRVLVDGGVIDNTPVGVMRQLHSGATILVNVSPPEQALLGDDLVDLPNNREILLSHLHPAMNARRAPSIGAVVVHTMCLSSAARGGQVAPDLRIDPEVNGYGIIDFESMPELIALGYNSTMEALERISADKEMVARLGLQPGSLPSRLPRREVPVWLGEARRKKRARMSRLRRTLWFGAAGVATLTMLFVLLTSQAHTWHVPAGVAMVLGLLFLSRFARTAAPPATLA